MTAFDTAQNAIFNDPNISVSATFTPQGGAGKTVRVVVSNDVELVSTGFADVADRVTVIGVRKTDVPSPKRGDTFDVSGKTYSVDSVIADDGYSVQIAVR